MASAESAAAEQGMAIGEAASNGFVVGYVWVATKTIPTMSWRIPVAPFGKLLVLTLPFANESSGKRLGKAR